MRDDGLSEQAMSSSAVRFCLLFFSTPNQKIKENGGDAESCRSVSRLANLCNVSWWRIERVFGSNADAWRGNNGDFRKGQNRGNGRERRMEVEELVDC